MTKLFSDRWIEENCSEYRAPTFQRRAELTTSALTTSVGRVDIPVQPPSSVSVLASNMLNNNVPEKIVDALIDHNEDRNEDRNEALINPRREGDADGDAEGDADGDSVPDLQSEGEAESENEERYQNPRVFGGRKSPPKTRSVTRAAKLEALEAETDRFIDEEDARFNEQVRILGEEFSRFQINEVY